MLVADALATPDGDALEGGVRELDGDSTAVGDGDPVGAPRVTVLVGVAAPESVPDPDPDGLAVLV